MCCTVGGDYQAMVELVQAMYEGELECVTCGAYCADTEPRCPTCGGVLQLPLADWIGEQTTETDHVTFHQNIEERELRITRGRSSLQR
jgi:hypothetical protein